MIFQVLLKSSIYSEIQILWCGGDRKHLMHIQHLHVQAIFKFLQPQ